MRLNGFMTRLASMAATLALLASCQAPAFVPQVSVPASPSEAPATDSIVARHLQATRYASATGEFDTSDRELDALVTAPEVLSTIDFSLHKLKDAKLAAKQGRRSVMHIEPDDYAGGVVTILPGPPTPQMAVWSGQVIDANQLLQDYLDGGNDAYYFKVEYTYLLPEQTCVSTTYYIHADKILGHIYPMTPIYSDGTVYKSMVCEATVPSSPSASPSVSPTPSPSVEPSPTPLPSVEPSPTPLPSATATPEVDLPPGLEQVRFKLPQKVIEKILERLRKRPNPRSSPRPSVTPTPIPPAVLEQRLNDVLKGTTPGKSSSSVQYDKTGGFQQAEKDFNYLTAGGNISIKPNGTKVAELPGWGNVNVRQGSSHGAPTLDIKRIGRRPVKIRYPKP